MRARGDRTGELRSQVEYRRCGPRLLADQAVAFERLDKPRGSTFSVG